ncbi:MAG TPA: futalosine hydrolase [Jatrophihabitans sp.]|jgi:futalosine hydrolase
MSRLLVVTAVDAEADAVGTHDGVDVLVGGVGPAASAAATAAALAGGGYGLVLSVGIAGGFAPLQPGDLAAASAVVFADLGAETEDGFTAIGELGFAEHARYSVDPRLATRLAAATGARQGTILTVATVTGTAVTASALAARYPRAVAEAMEGFGVAEAAMRFGVPFGELRAISNLVGPRDRGAWRIPEALAALRGALPGAVLAAAESMS